MAFLPAIRAHLSCRRRREGTGCRRSCRGWRRSEPVDTAQDVGEQVTTNDNLGHLERDVAPVAHDLRTDLDELLSQAGQLPLFHGIGQREGGHVPGHAVLDPFLQSDRGPEHDYAARGDWALLAGLRIAAYAFRLSAHSEGVERRQLHRLPGRKPFRDHIQHRVHELRGFIVRQPTARSTAWLKWARVAATMTRNS